MNAEEYQKNLAELEGRVEYTDAQLDDESFVKREGRRHDEHEKVKAAMNALLDAANRSGGKCDLTTSLVAGVVQGHRYLQNSLVEALLCALGTFGALPGGSYVDGRNALAQERCKRLREAFQEDLFYLDGKGQNNVR